MALAVQDDAGAQAGADAYISLAAWKAWADGRGRAYSGVYADAVIEAKLRAATQYIDTVSRWKGVKLTTTQTTEFPRASLSDWDGYSVEGVPQRVKDAACELTWSSLSSGEDLYVDLDRGGQVAAESVGPISVSYFQSAPVGKTFRAAMALLKPYMRAAQQLYPGYTGGTAGQPDTREAPGEYTPYFDIGMHSDRDTASAEE